MSLTARIWGCRGSVPTPGPATGHYGGNTPCVELRRGNVVFLLDAGTGIREAGIDLQKRNAAELNLHLFFSHTHWDHIQGFPFFQPVYDERVSLTTWDVPETTGRVQRLLSGQMHPDYFPVTFGELDAHIEYRTLTPHKQEIADILVSHLPQPHPGGCSAFAFEADGSKIVYLTDSELDSLLPDVEYTLRHPGERRGLPPALVEFVRGADLLIADGQYTDEAYPRHRGWGHPRASTTVDLAIAGEVGELALFHHDPMQTDTLLEQKIRASVARAEGSGVMVYGAREGLERAFGET